MPQKGPQVVSVGPDVRELRETRRLGFYFKFSCYFIRLVLSYLERFYLLEAFNIYL